MAKVKIDGNQCEQCGYIWAPRFKAERPGLCPRCKSLRWDKPPRSQVHVGRKKSTWTGGEKRNYADK